MKHIVIFALILVVGAGRVPAQNTGERTITGRIIEGKTGAPLPSVDVLLCRAADTAVIAHTSTDDNGRYSFRRTAADGNCLIKTVSPGYRESFSRTVPDSGRLPDILLEETEAATLRTVEITGKKQFVEQHADRMVINPEATVSAASDNVLDVLAKSPGVAIDKDGNITLKGKAGVRIMIDDKPTYLTAEQLSAMLKNLQSASVERIEIIENPPARYEAEGSSGIINIRTKRGMTRGRNGSVNLGAQAGRKAAGHAGGDLNYRNGKLNVFSNLWTGFSNRLNTVDLIRRFPQGDGSTFHEDMTGNGSVRYFGVKAGADYSLSETHVIGFTGKVSGWKWFGDNETKTTAEDAAGIATRSELTRNSMNEKGHEMSANLNYRWNIDTAGRSLSTDVDYAFYDYRAGSDMSTTVAPSTDRAMTRNRQYSGTSIFSFKADYVHPFNAKTRMEAGFKSSVVNIDSDMLFEQLDPTDNQWRDPAKMSNTFLYAENINAIYASISAKLTSKLDLQAGLRGEQTRAESNNVTIDSITRHNYFNLFPTFFLKQSFSDDHQLNLSYAYRIGRPNYWRLNPFVWMLNPYTYNRGNPLLQPQFTHSIKLSYTLKQKYILSAGYALSTDQYTQVFQQNDETKVTMITWRNLNRVNNTDLTLTIPLEPFAWWKVNANLTAFYLQYDSPLDNSVLNRSEFTARGNVTSTFSLPKDWAIELSGWYSSPSIYGVLDMRERGAMDVGIQKLMFSKKATLKLSVSDILNSMTNRYASVYRNMDVTGRETYDSRRVRLNLTWRFGSDEVKPARQRSSGMEEEAERAGK
jgi:hypothetical protein